MNREKEKELLNQIKEMAKQNDEWIESFAKKANDVEAICDEVLVLLRQPIADKLTEFASNVSPSDLTPTIVAEAADLIAEDPFAFILAVSLDRGTKAEIIWTIPFWIREQIGHLDPIRLAQMNQVALAQTLGKMPRKPRYINDAPQTILEISQMVTKEFSGNAELIWAKRNAQEIKSILKRVHGIGEGIASMAVILLERCRGIRFNDWSAMDVKPDVHVQRVLYRLGIIKEMNEKEAIKGARMLNPDYPGALDPALWVIGRSWCSKTNPTCSKCYMESVCNKTSI